MSDTCAALAIGYRLGDIVSLAYLPPEYGYPYRIKFLGKRMEGLLALPDTWESHLGLPIISPAWPRDFHDEEQTHYNLEYRVAGFLLRSSKGLPVSWCDGDQVIRLRKRAGNCIKALAKKLQVTVAESLLPQLYLLNYPF